MVGSGTTVEEYDAMLAAGSAGLYDFDEAVVAEVVSMGVPAVPESVATGGGLTAVVAGNGGLCVVMNAVDGDLPKVTAFAGTAEYPDPMAMYPEQVIEETLLRRDMTARQVAGFVASAIRRYLGDSG